LVINEDNVTTHLHQIEILLKILHSILNYRLLTVPTIQLSKLHLVTTYST